MHEAHKEWAKNQKLYPGTRKGRQRGPRLYFDPSARTLTGFKTVTIQSLRPLMGD